MPISRGRDASDLIRRNNSRMLYAHALIQKQNLTEGITNRIHLVRDKSSGSTLPMKGELYFTEEEREYILQSNSSIVPPAPVPIAGFINSKNNTTAGGFTIGAAVTKDMLNANYITEFIPFNRQPDFFPNMSEFVDSNIVVGDKNPSDRLIASYWNSLGDDVFNNWGFFYLYDVTSEKYYFPLFVPQNASDGVVTTQTFNVFGRTFTIKHGWTVQGIFKLDISVQDTLPFRFGTYGNMGSDLNEDIENLTHSYTSGGRNVSLYYQRHSQTARPIETLYSYWIPKNASDNTAITYDFYNDGDDNSMMSKQITNGVIVYFSKTNDVKEWVANDLQLV